jgi:hypothetical protein
LITTSKSVLEIANEKPPYFNDLIYFIREKDSLRSSSEKYLWYIVQMATVHILSCGNHVRRGETDRGSFNEVGMTGSCDMNWIT